MQKKTDEIRNCKKHGQTIFRFDGATHRCLKCSSERAAESRRKRKQQYVDLFGGACQICGYNKSIKALQFHHINPEEKEFGLSQKGDSKTLEKALPELRKCVLLCSNCHAEVHDGTSDIDQKIIDNNKIIVDEKIKEFKEKKKIKENKKISTIFKKAIIRNFNK